jgi:hypothetical protein
MAIQAEGAARKRSPRTRQHFISLHLEGSVPPSTPNLMTPDRRVKSVLKTAGPRDRMDLEDSQPLRVPKGESS